MLKWPFSRQNREIPPLDPTERRKRKREALAIVSLAVLFVILTIVELRLSGFSSSMPFLNSIFFFGLLNFNIIILVALSWLVVRNIGKLFIERRRKILGSGLKTKLVIAFLAFSIIPTLVLFIISASYINSSFDKWFSIKVQNTLQASLEITRTYYKNSDATAMHFAQHIAGGLARRIGSEPQAAHSPAWNRTPRWMDGYLEEQRSLLALDAVEYYASPLDPRLLARRSFGAGEPDIQYPRLSLDLLDRAFAGEQVSILQHIGSGDMIRCLVPVKRGQGNEAAVEGVVVVNTHIPVSLVNKVDEIASVFEDYKDTNPLKYPLKTIYFVILIMITLVIIFVAIWIGLYMARELTVPLQRLVFGAQAVGAGNLDVTIGATGHDEIAVLVDSFNKMTHDLRENQTRLTAASGDLQRRRLQLEAVLANIATGIIVVERSGEVTTFNPIAEDLLGLRQSQALGRDYRDLFVGDHAPLCELIGRHLSSPAGIPPSETQERTQWTAKAGKEVRSLIATMTDLLEDADARPWGVVVAIDDRTQVVKGQREMAWREVARRIAHEIKNPLTPIKLSAQRLQRRMGDYKGRDFALLQECTETIIRHTDELKEMVNEFSNFARIPEVNRVPNDLNAALKEVVSLYEQAHPDVTFLPVLDPKMPTFEFDRDQMKRVIINLFDNAVASLDQSAVQRSKLIELETHFHSHLRIAIVVVRDNGSGMPQDVLDRVFEPYFSTKNEGTGLGLAIAKRIVNDHDGFIRVQSVLGEGTQFSIELPISARQERGTVT